MSRFATFVSPWLVIAYLGLPVVYAKIPVFLKELFGGRQPL